MSSTPTQATPPPFPNRGMPNQYIVPTLPPFFPDTTSPTNPQTTPIMPFMYTLHANNTIIGPSVTPQPQCVSITTRALLANIRGPTTNTHGPTENTYSPTANTYGSITNTHDPTTNTHVPHFPYSILAIKVLQPSNTRSHDL